MSTIHSNRIKIQGLDIHYLTGGQGEPLIIVHGGGEGASPWMNNIRLLSHKYTIYVPDMPGFGSSECMEDYFYIPAMVDFIDQFAQSVGLQKFYLMGHSMGGGIALQYTLKHPEKIRKLVLVSSLCLGKEIAWWIRLFSIPVICRLLGRATMSFFRGLKCVAQYFGPWDIIQPVSQTSIQIGTSIANFTQQTVVLLSQLPKIMVPTLVMWGARDPIVPFAQAYAAAELIPDCRVKVFHNCGHSVYRDRIQEFSSELTTFLG